MRRRVRLGACIAVCLPCHLKHHPQTPLQLPANVTDADVCDAPRSRLGLLIETSCEGDGRVCSESVLCKTLLLHCAVVKVTNISEQLLTWAFYEPRIFLFRRVEHVAIGSAVTENFSNADCSATTLLFCLTPSHTASQRVCGTSPHIAVRGTAYVPPCWWPSCRA